MDDGVRCHVEDRRTDAEARWRLGSRPLVPLELSLELPGGREFQHDLNRFIDLGSRLARLDPRKTQCFAFFNKFLHKTFGTRVFLSVGNP